VSLRVAGAGVGSSVGQRRAGLVPDTLVGVEFGGIGRQGFQAQAPTAAKQGAYRVAPVAATIVPEHDDTPAQMLEQVPQEIGHRDIIEVGFRQTTKVESEVPLLGLTVKAEMVETFSRLR